MYTLIFIIFEIIKFIIIAVPVLISVAYLTLAERKVIGYTQTRKGPNVVGIYGLLQPLADGVKLFSKEMVIPNHVSIVLYFFAPILALTLALVVWGLMPLSKISVVSDLNLGILLIFALSSVGVYAILMSGWSSNSKYAFLGALRAAAQMISYEVSIGLIIISVILCSGSLNLVNIIHSQEQSIWFIVPLLPAGIMFFISCLAETNRAPFDLTEGESELVSGYNVEYSSMSFALFFLAEYAHIIFMSFLFALLFLGGWSFFISLDIIFFIKGTFIVFLFVWVRASFPRLRYDQLMSLLWKTYLPLSLSFIIIVNSLLWAFNGLPPISCI
uniref:NADH-ubiquinone oxidoreductase chain 1 n=1 Tax=Staurostoma mertensii TaxID=1804149 RepID=A0A0S2IC33_9CNID|nr:NADH dehydrogenase subunit 1 [Staurostoma mertensii]